MSVYSSKPVVIGTPINTAFAKLSDFSAYQARMEELPDDVRSRIGEVRFEPDAIVINAQPVGEMAFEVVERTSPSRVALKARNAPVPMMLSIDLKPEGNDATAVVSNIDVDIPVVLRPLVGGKMQEAADKFAELIATFFKTDGHQA